MLAWYYSHSTPGELVLLLHTLLCLLPLNCSSREHGTKAEKETKKVPGATATAMASKRRTSKRCVGGVRETQPAFWNLPREGANQNRRLIRRFYTQASVSKNCVDFPNVLDDNVFSSIFFISFFLNPFSSFSFFFCFSSNFGYLKISQQF